MTRLFRPLFVFILLSLDNSDQRMEPASITKIMTSYVVYKEMAKGSIGAEDLVTISEKAWRMGGSRMFIEVGTKVSVHDLLLGLVIQSGNDASVALAEYVAGSEESFADYMNIQARALGMENTHFVNATGLPHEDHYTTAYDVAILSRALIAEFPEHYEMYRQREFTYNDIQQYNRNKLLWRDDTVDGIKTGHTESAGYCLAASAERDGMRLISVVLGSQSENSRAVASRKLLGYGFRFYETHRLYAAGEVLEQPRIWKGASENLPLGLERDLFITIPRGLYAKLQASMNLPGAIEAPVAEGQVVGTVEVRLEDELVSSQPLVALAAVAEGNLLQKARDAVMRYFQ